MAKLIKIVEDLSSLSVIEASELSKLLEEKWGVSSTAPVAVAAVSTVGGSAEAAEEKSEFEVVLLEVVPIVIWFAVGSPVPKLLSPRLQTRISGSASGLSLP